MALPYELDGHAHDDAERLQDNKRHVTNYCALCEHYARSAEKLNDENRALREENARLRLERDQHAEVADRENARLRERLVVLEGLPAEKTVKVLQAEVKRLEGLILDWDNGWMGYPDARIADEPLMAEAKRIREGR